MTMATRDSAAIKNQGLSLVVIAFVVLVVVAWMLLTFLGNVGAELRCSISTPDTPMEECRDDHREAPDD